MTDDQALRMTICASPLDDSPRLVFADFLEESGDPECVARAEFIRVQIEIAKATRSGTHFERLQERESELAAEFRDRWVRAVATSVENARFHRGFVEEASIELGVLASCLATIELEPIQYLNLRLRSRDVFALRRAADSFGAAQLSDALNEMHRSAMGILPELQFTRRERGRWPRIAELLFMFDLAGGQLASVSLSKALTRLQTLTLDFQEMSVIQFNR